MTLPVSLFFTLSCKHPGGSGKAEGFADGGQANHWQAPLAAATRAARSAVAKRTTAGFSARMTRAALLVALGIVGPVAAQDGWLVPGQKAPPQDAFKVLLEKEGLYHYIRVVEGAGVRRLQFRRSGSEYDESAINVNQPLLFEMEYYPLMFAGFAHRPDPQRILFLGLGGGTISMAIRHWFPETRIDNIELDPDVVEVARKYFGFKEDKRNRIYVRDGRVQVRRLLREKAKYDIIFADAFRGGYIPYHLTTKEFMESLRELLTPDGVVVSNLQPGFESYHYHRRTFDAVFRNQCSYGPDGNVIVVVDTRTQALTRDELLATAQRLQEQKQFTFDLPAIMEERDSGADYIREGPILTDDYAPTDVLRGIPREAIR